MKSQKVVKFPFKDFDPTAYLASVPKHTVVRHRELERLRLEEADGDFICSPPSLNGGQEVISSDRNSEAFTVEDGLIEADLCIQSKHLGL